MYLKELTINGFKSFAKKSELEFSAPITAIVGPNGSGKSNIAESFRFVLGEQSVKSLRGKRGEDLIWGGSEKVSRGNRASVEVTFDNKSRAFALDFDEIRIERVVHRDGQNEYKLNDSTVRLKDIHELLANANIGATGHHIISQGEADRVLAAGPKERREMIEDALGLKIYQLKKQETEQKLQKTLENIAQVESLRREAAPHVKYLKKQVEKAERSLEVQKELRSKYAEYLKREDVYVAFRSDVLTKERLIPLQAIGALDERLKVIKQLLQKTENSPEKNNLTQVEVKLEAALSKRQERERMLSALQGQISFLERRLETAKTAPAVVQEMISRTQLEKLVLSIEAIIEKALSKGGESVLERTLSDVLHQLRTFLKRESGEVIDTSKEDRIELEQLQKKLAQAEELVQQAKAEEQHIRQEFQKIREAEIADSQINRDTEREMFTLINERREHESAVRIIDAELAVLERDRVDFKQQLQEAVALLGRGAADYYTVTIIDGGTPLTDEVIASEDRSKQRARQHELEKLKIRLEELGVGATEELLKEYNDAVARDEFLARELADLEQSVQNLKTLTVEMQEKLQAQFSAGLDKITKEFNTFFTVMFGGGSAALERVTLKSKKHRIGTRRSGSHCSRRGGGATYCLAKQAGKRLGDAFGRGAGTYFDCPHFCHEPS